MMKSTFLMAGTLVISGLATAAHALTIEAVRPDAVVREATPTVITPDMMNTARPDVKAPSAAPGVPSSKTATITGFGKIEGKAAAPVAPNQCPVNIAKDMASHSKYSEAQWNTVISGHFVKPAGPCGHDTSALNNEQSDRLFETAEYGRTHGVASATWGQAVDIYSAGLGESFKTAGVNLDQQDVHNRAEQLVGGACQYLGNGTDQKVPDTIAN